MIIDNGYPWIPQNRPVVGRGVDNSQRYILFPAFAFQRRYVFLPALCTFYEVESSLFGRSLNGVGWPSPGYLPCQEEKFHVYREVGTLPALPFPTQAAMVAV